MENDLNFYEQVLWDEKENVLDKSEIKAIIEGLLFTSGEPLSLDEISGILEMKKSKVRDIINEMIEEFNKDRRGIQVIEFRDKYQLCTRPEHAKYIKRLLKPKPRQSLSRAALETLAIIAYKQPVTRQSIDSIRGVKSDKIIESLIEKKLVKDAGRLETPGRPIIYKTTDEFLKYFSLKDISDLPQIEDIHHDE
ncbi:MAG: SMC-Scp complex subunit ScpB [Clostridiales bacterium]|nr:SMC-Scp complex subunit ScpB [Clostridiales bacterium]HBM81978.1 SMC-Scp complex subunit ScpB [Clostridiaceae bacterium]